MNTPTPDEIRHTRKLARLTQEEAAESVGLKRRIWIEYENGNRTMRPSTWQLFNMKIKLSPDQLAQIAEEISK